MKIVIAGGTGFVGKALTKLLQEQGHELFVLSRSNSKYENGIHYVQWLQDGARPEKELDNIDAFVNLAGVSLNDGRWTKNKRRRFIRVGWMLH